MRAITAAPTTSANSGSSKVTKCNCTAPQACKRWKPRRADARCAASTAAKLCPATVWSCPLTSSCKSWWKTCTASAVGLWWRLIRRPAKFWRLSASPRSTPTCLSTASTLKTGKRSTSPSTSPCSTVPCAAPTRQGRLTNRSWRWRLCKRASAQKKHSFLTLAISCSATTVSAMTKKAGTAWWTCTNPSSSPVTPTTTHSLAIWAWT